MNLKWITIWFLLFPALLQGQPYQISLEQVLNEWCLDVTIGTKDQVVTREFHIGV